jgi:hypothetical protein
MFKIFIGIVALVMVLIILLRRRSGIRDKNIEYRRPVTVGESGMESDNLNGLSCPACRSSDVATSGGTRYGYLRCNSCGHEELECDDVPWNG